jgi:hypothetical protein
MKEGEKSGKGINQQAAGSRQQEGRGRRSEGRIANFARPPRLSEQARDGGQGLGISK